MQDSDGNLHTEPTLNPREAVPPGLPGAGVDLVGIGLAASAGLAVISISVFGLVQGVVSMWLGGALALLGIGVLVAVAGLAGWSLARRPPPLKRGTTEPSEGLVVLVFGCGDAPLASWIERLIELPAEERREMALRVPRIRRGVRWIAYLLQVLEHQRESLRRVVLVMDDVTYAPPVRTALDRLVRAHFDPMPGLSPTTITIEHLALDEPDDPEQVFAAVSGKLHEQTLRGCGRRDIAVAPATGSSPTDMALTLAASTHNCELIYFPGENAPDQGPERFPIVN